MPQSEQFDVLILGSGTAGKLMAWDMAELGRRTAVVERRWVGGACPNIACMPSKNEIRSAEVAHLARHAAQFGAATGPVKVDMATVRRRKRDMVEAQIATHLQNYKKSGAELIMGTGRFVAPKMLEVSLNDGGTRTLAGSQVFLDVWRTAGQFRGRSQVSTWLLSIARFKALTALRQRKHEDIDQDDMLEIADGGETPEACLDRSTTSAILRACVAKLSPAHRAIINLVYYNENSVEEAGAIIGIPQSTVKTRMRDALIRLRDCLGVAG